MYNQNFDSPNIMEINIKNFKNNIKEIQKLVGDNVTIMPIIKANAYGTYINTELDIIKDFKIVGVANVSEGIDLRKIGFKNDIFVLNQPFISEIDKIIDNNLIVGVSSNSFIEALKEKNKKIKIHIEIGTGMGRTGINPNRALEFTQKILENKNIIIDGIYTHLSSADIDYEYTKNQLQSFDYAINEVKKLVSVRYIHSSASNGIINFPNSHYNLVRPGIIIYGYPSSFDTYEKINIKPICTLKSRIIFLKHVPKNTSIGYGRSFITNKDMVIATIPLGYADGIKRNLSNNGYVLINGKKANIIGNICMDSFMVDVTEIDDVKTNDTVYIWDNKEITVEDISQKINTINYEIISTISARVPRKFIK